LFCPYWNGIKADHLNNYNTLKIQVYYLFFLVYKGNGDGVNGTLAFPLNVKPQEGLNLATRIDLPGRTTGRTKTAKNYNRENKTKRAEKKIIVLEHSRLHVTQYITSTLRISKKIFVS